MNPQAKKWLKSFLIELVVYAVLVFGYFFLVLHFLGGWLNRLFEHDRKWYAVAALGLIICQGIVLEGLTRALLSLIKPGEDEE
ncbi:MAG TPA: hypothetical protein VN794_03865 [Methylomirabilota bacterium]|jgi:hypothetical protein|nr:hypothetical protein [Methylomirabilota bacterium]